MHFDLFTNPFINTELSVFMNKDLCLDAMSSPVNKKNVSCNTISLCSVASVFGDKAKLIC